MDNIVNIFLGGILISSVLTVAYRGFVLSFARPQGDVYTTDKGKAKYGKHIGPVDDGLTQRIRERVYREHGHVCKITGRSGFPGDADTNGQYLAVGIGLKVELQVGHIIPRNLGGPTEMWNLIPMEKKLNNRLKDKITPMAERLVRRRGEMIWSHGIKKTTFTAEKKKLASKRRWNFSLN